MAWRIEQARGLSRAHRWASYHCVQQRHSYLRPHGHFDFDVQQSAAPEFLNYCRSTPDLTLLAYSPLLGGVYGRDDLTLPQAYAGPDAITRLQALRSLATELAVTPNQLALAWLMPRAPRAIPVIAVSTAAQLAENLAAIGISLSSDHLARLQQAGPERPGRSTGQRLDPFKPAPRVQSQALRQRKPSTVAYPPVKPPDLGSLACGR